MIFMSLFLGLYNYVFGNSFFLCTATFWNSLAIECFPLTYDLNSSYFVDFKHIFVCLNNFLVTISLTDSTLLLQTMFLKKYSKILVHDS